MSIASRIEEIETHIGDVYDTINYSYDTTDINKNIINIPKYLKKGYIDIINNGIDTLYNNFPKVSGTGTNLSLTPTYEAPIKLNEIQGDTLQDSQPTPDTPVEIQSVTGLQNINVCGKNIFDTSNAESRTHNGITFTLNNDGSIKANGTASSLAFMLVLSQEQSPLYKAGNYAFSLSNEMPNNCYVRFEFYDSNNTMILRKDITTNGTATLLQNCYLKVSYVIASGTVLNNFVNYIQIEVGSTATDYEPYKGNTYEVNLGKNLLNASQESYTLPANEDNSQIFGQVYLEKNIKYYISFDIENNSTSNTRSTIYLQTGNRTRIYQDAGTNKNLTKGRKVWEYTPTQSAIYNVGYWLHTSNVEVTISNYMVSKSSDTEYTPYFTPIELNKIGDYQDRIYKDNGKWYVEKQIGKTIITESNKNIIESFGTQNNHNRILINKTNLGWQTSWLRGVALLNKYKEITSASAVDTGCFGTNFTQVALTIWNDNFTDLTTAQNLLIGTEILIAQATPTITEITNTELIEDLETLYTAKSQEGTTNISITSEDLSMILNVSALKSE